MSLEAEFLNMFIFIKSFLFFFKKGFFFPSCKAIFFSRNLVLKGEGILNLKPQDKVLEWPALPTR